MTMSLWSDHEMIIPLSPPSGLAHLGLLVDATVCLCHEPRQFDELVAVRSLVVSSPHRIDHPSHIAASGAC